MFHIHRTPRFLKWLFPSYTWKIETTEKVIFLTFDDGPIPEITDFVLDQLALFDAKATFFCVGENIHKHPSIFNRIITEKHTVGNHTYNHLKGWQTTDNEYLKNINLCKKAILEADIDSHLFRPPYGRVKRSQSKILESEYKIIMWDVLSCDYDKNLESEKCLQNTINATKSGSIVVFHDSIKAEKNLKYVLPRYLSHFSKLGFRFESINPNS
jgi:peptidoglycan/xylan/chitin deacetylase (PgdA/CDA1 family)